MAKQDTLADLDLDLSATRKKRIRINGDNNAILELNTSDMNIASRAEKVYQELIELAEKVPEISVDVEVENGEDISEESLKKVGDMLTDLDKQMRIKLDELFDAPVSEICAPHGSMYDPFDGKYRFEHIIEGLAKLYENNFTAEVEKIKKNINKHTAKYTKSKKR